MQLYKVLGRGPEVGGGPELEWPLPQGGEPGAWVKTPGGSLDPRFSPCLDRAEELLDRLGPTLWLAEAAGATAQTERGVACSQARLVSRVEGWTDASLRRFACDCAEHAIAPVWGGSVGDATVLKGLTVARAFADGTATNEDLAAARQEAAAAAKRAEEQVAAAAAGLAQAREAVRQAAAAALPLSQELERARAQCQAEDPYGSGISVVPVLFLDPTGGGAAAAIKKVNATRTAYLAARRSAAKARAVEMAVKTAAVTTLDAACMAAIKATQGGCKTVEAEARAVEAAATAHTPGPADTLVKPEHLAPLMRVREDEFDAALRRFGSFVAYSGPAPAAQTPAAPATDPNCDRERAWQRTHLVELMGLGSSAKRRWWQRRPR